jgi:hypothetical protein
LVTVQPQTFALAKKVGLGTIALRHCARKNVQTVGSVQHQTYAHVNNGGAYGAMRERVVEDHYTVKKTEILSTRVGQVSIVQRLYAYKQKSLF